MLCIRFVRDVYPLWARKENLNIQCSTVVSGGLREFGTQGYRVTVFSVSVPCNLHTQRSKTTLAENLKHVRSLATAEYGQYMMPL